MPLSSLPNHTNPKIISRYLVAAEFAHRTWSITGQRKVNNTLVELIILGWIHSITTHKVQCESLFSISHSFCFIQSWMSLSPATHASLKTLIKFRIVRLVRSISRVIVIRAKRHTLDRRMCASISQYDCEWVNHISTSPSLGLQAIKFFVSG
jgi:hypothetical protein